MSLKNALNILNNSCIHVFQLFRRIAGALPGIIKEDDRIDSSKSFLGVRNLLSLPDYFE